MISILIPVYNHDVNLLASTLSRQLSAIEQPGEIILLDDGSAEEYKELNAATASLPHVKYAEANANHGRIRIRQLLAEKAAFSWLLFLDCDSEIISIQFLENYYRELLSNPGPGLFVGGRIYRPQEPEDCSLRLHWKYGIKRESLPAAAFMTNNFMVHKDVFSRLQFPKDWQGYGHEDTWIGMQLQNEGTKARYIDNAVVHDGLEKAETFIAKSEDALQNLNRLADNKQLKEHVKLFRIYLRLKFAGLLWLPKMLYGLLKKTIHKNLRGCHPSLFYFDLYRLNRFIEIRRST